MKNPEYEIKPGVVNGEIIQDLLDVLNGFVNRFSEHPFQNACIYCGRIQEHYSNCLINRYKETAEKHSKFIKETPEGKE